MEIKLYLCFILDFRLIIIFTLPEFLKSSHPLFSDCNELQIILFCLSQDAGVVVLTDALIYEHVERKFRHFI